MDKSEKTGELKKIVLDILRKYYNCNIQVKIHASVNGSVKVNIEEIDI
jgi:hypothetical protein